MKLNLEQLAVDSFDTSIEPATRGTVFGEQQCTCPTVCSCPGCPTCQGYNTCDNQNTCAVTCPYTCDDFSCDPTCPAQWTCHDCG
jgi:hypothetical protein